MKVPRFLKRIFWVLGILLLFVVVVVALLPRVVGSRRIQSRVVEIVNRGLAENQHVSWESVRLGWFRSQSIENIVFEDEGISVSIDRISLDKGLVSLIGRTIDIGTLAIVRPQIAITLPDVEKRDPAAVDPDAEPDRPHRRDAYEYTEDDVEVVVREHEPVQFAIDVIGKVHIQNGSLQVRNAADSQKMVWEDIDVKLGFPSGLRDTVTLDFIAQQPHEGSVGEVALSSSARFFQEDGSFHEESFHSDMSLTLQDIHIGSIAWIPYEMADAPMVEGTLDMGLEAGIAGGDEMSVSYLLDARDILIFGGPLGEDRLDLGEVKAETKAHFRDQSFQIETLRVDNNLLQLTGEGVLEEFGQSIYPIGDVKLDLRADVAGALMQLPNTVPLHEGMKLHKGMLILDAALGSDGQVLSLSGNVALPHVQFEHDAVEIDMQDLLKSQFAFKLTESGPIVDELVVQTPFAEIEGSGDLDSMRVRGDVNLDAARDVAAQFIDMGTQIMEGAIQLAAHLEAEDDDTRSFQFTAESSGLRYGVSEEQVFALDAVNMETEGNLHFVADSFDLLRASELRLVLRSDPFDFRVTVPDLDLQTELPAFSVADVQWDADMQKLHAILTSAGVLEDDLSFAGLFTGASSLSLQDDILSVSSFDANLADLRFKAADLEWEDPSVSMRWAGELQLPPRSPEMVLTNGVVESSALSLQLPKIRFTMPEDALPMIAVQDALVESDLGALGPMIQTATGAPIEMKGMSRISLTWHSPIDPAWEDMLREGQGEADIRIPRIKAYGLLATNVVTTMQAGDGLVNLSLDTAANDGRVVLEPVIDVTGEEPMLRMPDDSHVIQEVTLTDEMATELLALVHPLLRGSTVLGGMVDLTLNTCRIPLTESGVKGANLRGEFLLRDLDLEPRGSLARVIETSGLRSQRVQIERQRITFYVEEGRIHPSPLQLAASGYTFSVAGSVGLDSSLDYRVEVPLSRELVGSEAYRYLEGKTLALPIGGTVTNPEIASDAFARGVRELATKALEDAVRDRGEDAVRDLFRRIR